MSGKVVSAVFERSNAPATARLVLAAIGAHAHDDGTGAWPSVETLADETGLARSTVQRNIRKAEQLGELVVRPRPGRTSMFTLTCLAARPRHREGAVDAHPGGQHSAAGEPHSAAQTVPKPSIEPSVCWTTDFEETRDAEDDEGRDLDGSRDERAGPPRETRPSSRGPLGPHGPRDDEDASVEDASVEDASVEDASVEDAFQALESCPWWPKDAYKEAMSVLRGALAARPEIAVAAEARRFVEYNSRPGRERLRNPSAALRAWLARALPARSGEAEHYCSVTGCHRRGYGTPQVCMPHRRLGLGRA